MHSRILLYGVLAAVSALAAAGLWFIWSTHPSLPLWLALPLVAKIFFLILAFLIRTARHTAFESGVSLGQIDRATRLPSRAVAQQVLALEFAAAERGRELVIVLFSIDNYQRIAPLDGGARGERLLLGAGAVLRRRTRSMNVSAQHTVPGQFISVLGGASVEGARTFASRVRNDLAALKVGPVPIVRSAIMAYEPGMESVESLIREAEERLKFCHEKEPQVVLLR